MTDLDAARQRISDLGDEKARLQGLYAGALNRIRVLEDERNALRKGLDGLVGPTQTLLNEVETLARNSYSRGDGRTFESDWENEVPDEYYAFDATRNALAAAQALLGGKESSNSEEFLDRKDFGADVVPSLTERPIQAGDTVRHKMEGWEKTVESIIPAEHVLAVEPLVIFTTGGFWRLSQLERVETAEPKS